MLAATQNGNNSGNSSEDEGRVQVRNPHIKSMKEDVLYHLALGTKSHDLKKMFSDVKFVCVGGSPRRMERFANDLLKVMEIELPAGQALDNIAGATDRYALYKVGPVLCCSHGMGMPSINIMLHEMFKLLHHAECGGVTLLRIGTSGGLGLEPGTVVVSDETWDALFQPQLDQVVLGKLTSRPAVLDKDLVKELLAIADPKDGYKVIAGKTMCTMDFYEGQGRLDGAFCDYTEEQKMAYLHEAYDKGVRNIEMESLCFAAMCHHVGVRGAVVCVTLLDRLKGDQIDTPHQQLTEWGERPARLVAQYIKRHM